MCRGVHTMNFLETKWTQVKDVASCISNQVNIKVSAAMCARCSQRKLALMVQINELPYPMVCQERHLAQIVES